MSNPDGGLVGQVAEEPGRTPVADYRRAGERHLESGSPLVAYDVLAQGLSEFPADVRLRQLAALALARSGASGQANEMLRALADEGHTDEETLGLLGRTHKDLWAEGATPAGRDYHLDRAYHAYLEGYRRTGGIWSGINAATLAMLLGHGDQAAALAREVRGRCEQILQSDSNADRYWLVATLAEAALLLGDTTAAEDLYRQAAAVAGSRYGDIASTRRNARLILKHLRIDSGPIEACLHTPRIVVFVGHLIDRPGRVPPRFPPSLEPAVREALRERLRELAPGFGYASAGCGGDIIFHELLHELGAESHVVLPYGRDQFVADSVDLVPGSDWPARFARVLDRARTVIVSADRRMIEASASFEYGALMLDGAAAIRADELDTELVSLALWDGRSGDGPGGTAATVARWREMGRRIELLDLTAIAGEQESAASGTREQESPSGARDQASGPGGMAGEIGHLVGVTSVIPVGPDPRQTARDVPDVLSAASRQAPAGAGSAAGPGNIDARIVAMLFGDARGFSKLREEEIPLFTEHFLGAIAEELERCPNPPVLRNTWGDGLYIVFDTVRDAGCFALRLCDHLETIHWEGRGFSSPMGLRLALHAGPAYAMIDPVTRRPNFFGAHVSRAARIEPITPAGLVYASGAFTALSRAAGVADFAFTYVGQVPFAKGYGTFPIYRLRPRR